jgi:hypothetical protein
LFFVALIYVAALHNRFSRIALVEICQRFVAAQFGDDGRIAGRAKNKSLLAALKLHSNLFLEWHQT